MSQAQILKTLREEDLRASGLAKPSVMKKLRIVETLTREQTYQATGIENAVSYEIPYFGPDGELLRYHRWKIIPIADDVGVKYYQEEKTIPRLYLPPLTDWKEVCADAGARLMITEGEKKAACATLMGLPCISVGGVWSWKSKGWHLREIPDFEWFDMKNRDVEVCYDGDMYENKDVSKALDALTSYLTGLGARVYVRRLPTLEGISKLDDFLVERGVEAYLQLDCPEADNSAQMRQLNDDLVYIKDTQTYFSTHDRILYGDVGRLKRNYGDIKLISESGKQIAAIDEWVQWPHMRKVDRMTYAPGEDSFFRGMLNDWPGWGVEPKRGKVGPFLEVIRSVEGWEWLLQWLAYPLQHPGAKLFTSVLLWSVEQGTGKTFIGDVMRDIYGQNSNAITSVDLHDDSFVWLRNRQFILGEEVSQTRSKADLGILKHLITGDTIRVNEKYVPSYELPNCANFLFTSNKPDALILDRTDRRFFVGRLDTPRPQMFWNDLDRWRKIEGGPSAFMHYLMNNVDVSEFNPNAPPPDTADKSMMQDASMTSLEQWVAEMLEDPAAIIADKFDAETAKLTLRRDLFTVAQILEWLPDDLRSTNRVALGKALTMCGAVKNSSPVRTKKGMVRLIAIQNLSSWRERVGENKEWAAHYDGKLKVMRQRRRKT